MRPTAFTLVLLVTLLPYKPTSSATEPVMAGCEDRQIGPLPAGNVERSRDDYPATVTEITATSITVVSPGWTTITWVPRPGGGGSQVVRVIPPQPPSASRFPPT